MGHYACAAGKEKVIFSRPRWLENERVIYLYGVQMTELLKEPWPTYSRLMQGERAERAEENMCEDREREREIEIEAEIRASVLKRHWDGEEGEALLCTGRQSEIENENVFPSRRD